MTAATRRCPGAISAGTGMRLAVTAAEDAGPKAPILLRGEVADVFRQARDIGYDGIELHVPDIWTWNANAAKDAAEATGVQVSALVSGQLFVRKGLSFSSDDPRIVEKAVEGLQLFVDVAATLGTGVVVGWVRGQVSDSPQGRLKRQADALRQVAEYASVRGVPLYIESINRYELDSLNTAAEIVSFIRENRLPNTYIHLDTFHMNIDEHSAAKAIRQCGSLLGYLHIAENTRWYPGHDRMDFDPVFTSMDRIGYDGFVSVECLPYPTGGEAARLAYDFLHHRYF
ncbi:MAG: sugar phosphate isomerase/epimerase [Planctomycetes bacterium]|nr:sugar phosphate isomerase/epimerase [Planctomycetota bacterium]